MSNRKEKIQNLKPFMLIYNFSCMCAAAYCMIGVLTYLYKKHGKDDATFTCNPTDLVTKEGKDLSWVIYIFYVQKFWYYFKDFYRIRITLIAFDYACQFFIN